MAALNEDGSFSILAPAGMLGYGYNLTWFWAAMDKYKPMAIICDSGSSDPGPFLLGTGQMLNSRASYIRDLSPMLEACFHRKVKVLVSSAGGAGTDAQADTFLEIIDEIAKANHWQFNVAAIYSSVDKDLAHSKFAAGKIQPCGAGPAPLQKSDIEAAQVIVAQIGSEPFSEVLKDESIDVIISGRSYDPAPFAAFAMHHGVERSTAWHMGKIIECGAVCALPKGKTIIATCRKDSFDLVPANPDERCTPISVAAHTLYEKTRPDQLPGPGGILHLDGATYEQLEDGRTTRVRGSNFVPSPRYQVKLEGVERVGYRSIFIGGIRDPILIAGLDPFLDYCRTRTREIGFPDMDPASYHMKLHVYGRNAVMDPLEPIPTAAHEIGILGEVTAPTQEDATAISSFLRVCVLHSPYEGQVATAGNFALPLTPLDNPIGPVYKFSMWHVMDVEGEQLSLFPRKTLQVGGQRNGHIPKGGNFKYAPLAPGQFKSKAAKVIPSGPAPLKDIARIIRSKNAGPFELTFDVMFNDLETYERVKKADVLKDEVIMSAYQLKNKSDIVYNSFYRPALAWKCTILRPWPQGSVGETDTFGAQQHAPLLDIIVPAV